MQVFNDLNVNSSLAFKTQLKLTKTPGVITSSHSFTDDIVLSTEIRATLIVIPQKHTHNPTKKDPIQFNFLTSNTITLHKNGPPLLLPQLPFYDNHLKIIY